MIKAVNTPKERFLLCAIAFGLYWAGAVVLRQYCNTVVSGLVVMVLLNGLMLSFGLWRLRRDFAVTLFPTLGSFLRGVPEGFGFGLLMALVMYALRPRISGVTSSPWFFSPLNLSVSFFLTVLSATTEEVFFRAYLDECLTPVLKHRWVVILVISLLFAVGHLPSGSKVIFRAAFLMSLYFFLLKRAYGYQGFSVLCWTHLFYNMFVTTILKN